jgi:Uma2 family endonuclease
MATQASVAELIAALGRVDGKAEVVDGEIVVMSPAGYAHNRAAGSIYVSLRQYERETRRGVALSDNAGFVVDLPHRKSFSPDAAFYVGSPPGPGFLRGAPIFAAEVRSPDDYGPLAEEAMVAKRADYFASGTVVVWDVDVLRDAWIAVYRAVEPDRPTFYRRGEVAEAEPGLPGWTFPVDRLFE